MKGELATFLLAIQFLTRLPVPASRAYTPERMAASVRYYPMAGALVGGLSAFVFWAASLVFPQTLSVILAIAAGLLITGGFHEDGLADSFDGVGGGATREKSLVIMRDSRIGVYGALALVIALALKVAALAALPLASVAAALVIAHGLSRLSSVIVIATSRYVRDDGTGKPVAGGVSAGGLVFAGLTGVASIGAGFAVEPFQALAFGVAGLAIAHVGMRLFFEPKLGGYTGDTLGAVQQASEIGFYLGLAAWL